MMLNGLLLKRNWDELNHMLFRKFLQIKNSTFNSIMKSFRDVAC